MTSYLALCLYFFLSVFCFTVVQLLYILIFLHTRNYREIWTFVSLRNPGLSAPPPPPAIPNWQCYCCDPTSSLLSTPGLWLQSSA